MFEPPHSIRNWPFIILLALLYFIAAKLGLMLAGIHPSATAVWPPSGIALAALLLFGYRLWPGIFVGAFLANITTAGTAATSLGIATGNSLEALVGAYLVNRFCNGVQAFDRAQDVFKFTFLAAVVSTAVSATLGITSLALGGYAGWSDYGAVWLTWWIGDAAGVLIIAPLLILWSRNPRIRWDRWKILEALLLLFYLYVADRILSGGWSPIGRLPFLYLPILVWAAFRLGQRETATVALLIAGSAIWRTLQGVGPFVQGTENESFLLIGAYMSTVTVTAMALAAGVSERRRVEEQLRRHAAELEFFSYALAHDLRSPIVSIEGLGQIVMTDYAERLDPAAQGHLRRIIGHAEQMDALIKDLLAYSKLSRADLRPQRMSLKSALSQVLGQLAGQISQSRSQIYVEEPLPEVLADPVVLSQIISNLLTNAIKFVEPGVSPKVRVWAEKNKQGVRLWVHDNGIGIAPEHKERIFQIFERLYGDDNYPGTGIGLAIVDKGVERLGGRSGVESEPGKGSRFWIELPIEPAIGGLARKA